MYSREEARKRLEQDIMGFRIMGKAFQEIIDEASRRIEEIKYLGKEIYGVDLHDVKSAGEQFRALSEKGEGEFLDWAKRLAEGIMLEEGRKCLKRRKLEAEQMLKMLRGALARAKENG